MPISPAMDGKFLTWAGRCDSCGGPWSGLDIEAVSGVLQRARQSVCEWPSLCKLRYRDVVHYVVVDEYMRSHLTDVRGTYTDMRRVVASIPYHL